MNISFCLSPCPPIQSGAYVGLVPPKHTQKDFTWGRLKKQDWNIMLNID